MNKTKISNAGYRMLEVLKALCQKPLTAQEILSYLEDTTDSSYRKELILKYINTLKLLGIDIIKTDGKYCLEKSLECVDFDKNDLSVILFLRKYIDKINHESLKDSVYETLEIIEKSFSTKTISLLNSSDVKAYKYAKPLRIYDENIRNLEKFCKDELKIELIYKNKTAKSEQKYILAPIKIIYKKGKAVLIAFSNTENEYKEFLTSNIIEAKQLPQKHSQQIPASVLFKLKNRLAKSYMLKPNETVIEYGKDFRIISNKGENKNSLIKRLIRYYDQCEILYPKSCRQQMLDTINEMEKLYE